MPLSCGHPRPLLQESPASLKVFSPILLGPQNEQEGSRQRYACPVGLRILFISLKTFYLWSVKEHESNARTNSTAPSFMQFESEADDACARRCGGTPIPQLLTHPDFLFIQIHGVDSSICTNIIIQRESIATCARQTFFISIQMNFLA